MESKRIVIFDLDGTIALNEHRQHHITSKPKNWDAFHAACGDDEPNIPVISVMNELYGQYEIWIVSGRDDSVSHVTIPWLQEHNVKYDHIIMRKRGDFTPDDELKRHWLNTIIPRERVALVFDDRKRVVDMWRKEGLTCFQVAEGDF